jgi:hypothetical protein
VYESRYQAAHCHILGLYVWGFVLDAAIDWSESKEFNFLAVVLLHVFEETSKFPFELYDANLN